MKTFILACCCILAAAWARAQIINVPGDFPTIQQGINAANTGDTVLVAEGVYFERINFMGKKPLTVASRFILDGNKEHIVNTVIDGSMIPYANNASVVYFILGEDTTSTLCGFTIRNGRGTLCHGYGTMTRTGGAIYISGSGARIANNHITQNRVCYNPLANNVNYFYGGAIATEFEASDEWVILEHNTIDYNHCIGGKDEAAAGGVFITCNALITDNDISNNTCTGQLGSSALGGGLVCATLPEWNAPASVLIANNTIENNHVEAAQTYGVYGGGLMQFVTGKFQGNDVMDNIAISGNTGGGVGGFGLYNPQEGSIVRDNTFARNSSNTWSGGLNIEKTEAHTEMWGIVVENNYFLENHAHEGGAMTVFNVPVCLFNNVFTGNSADYRAGGILAWKDYNMSFPYMIRLINNSFRANTSQYGGAVYSVKSKPLVVNTIFYDNIAGMGADLYVPLGKDTAEVAYSNIDFSKVYGRYKDRGGNMCEDPLFDNSQLLTLLPESPCMNAGIETYTCACGMVQCCPGYDIDGIPRPENGAVDIGAHELLFAGIPVPAPDKPAQWCKVYPNPAADQVNFEYELTESGHYLLEVFDVTGKLVATLLNSDQSLGRHLLQWDAGALMPGIYFYRLSGEGQRAMTSGNFIRL